MAKKKYEDDDPSFRDVCSRIDVSPDNNITIVDYGCGDARFAIKGLKQYLAEATLKKISYIGVDIDEDILKQAKDNTTLFGFTPPTIREKPSFLTVNKYYKLHDYTADFIFIIVTLHDVKLKDLGDLFYNNIRILKEGGKIIVYDKREPSHWEETNHVVWDEDDFDDLCQHRSLDLGTWHTNPPEKDRGEIHVIIQKKGRDCPSIQYFKNQCLNIYKRKQNRMIKLLHDFEEKERRFDDLPDPDKITRNALSIQLNSLANQIVEYNRRVEKKGLPLSGVLLMALIIPCLFLISWRWYPQWQEGRQWQEIRNIQTTANEIDHSVELLLADGAIERPKRDGETVYINPTTGKKLASDVFEGGRLASRKIYLNEQLIAVDKYEFDESNIIVRKIRTHYRYNKNIMKDDFNTKEGGLLNKSVFFDGKESDSVNYADEMKSMPPQLAILYAVFPYR